MTLLVRDEEDILTSMIEYHLRRGVDFLIATDNRSVDGSREVLRAYERRGVLYYIAALDDDYAQGRWVTKMARMAYTDFQADWVINSDADEFWWPQQGTLHSIFENIDRGAEAISVDRINFVPRATIGEELFANVMTVCEKHSTNVFGDPLPSKVCHRASPDIAVAQGNHAVHRDGRALPVTTAPLTILHFPMRTYRQFANKISKGGAGYSRNTELSPEVGSTWRKLYALWEAGRLAEFYNSSVFDDLAIENGLKQGRLLFDDRLKRFLAGTATV